MAAVEKIEDQRKPEDFFGNRDLQARLPRNSPTITYPGVAELVPRRIWDAEIARSSRVTRTSEPL